MGEEGGESDFNFLKAGPRQGVAHVALQPKSISPLEIDEQKNEIVVESDADDEGGVMEAGDQVERLALEKDEAIIRKLVDPKLPSEKEVEEHYVRGHFPYRNWCYICVKAKGKIWVIKRRGERRGRFLSIILIIVSLGMNWDSNGRFW